MKIAVAQTEIRQDDLAYNLQKAERWIAEAAFNQAELILFPEMSFTGFSNHLQLQFAAAETIFQRMQTTAKQHRIHIGFGWTSAESDGRGKNHYTILTPDGESCLDYTKIHPFSYCQEDRFFQKGTQLAHATISGIPVSVLICYDLRFPEVFRIAARSAALIFVPANWLSRRSRHWQILLQARAIENQVYLLGVNCVGTQGDLQFVGGSQLVDPEGTVRLDCGSAEQLAYVTVDSDVAEFRQAFPTYRDSQTALYADLYQTVRNNH